MDAARLDRPRTVRVDRNRDRRPGRTTGRCRPPVAGGRRDRGGVGRRRAIEGPQRCRRGRPATRPLAATANPTLVDAGRPRRGGRRTRCGGPGRSPRLPFVRRAPHGVRCGEAPAAGRRHRDRRDRSSPSRRPRGRRRVASSSIRPPVRGGRRLGRRGRRPRRTDPAGDRRRDPRIRRPGRRRGEEPRDRASSSSRLDAGGHRCPRIRTDRPARGGPRRDGRGSEGSHRRYLLPPRTSPARRRSAAARRRAARRATRLGGVPLLRHRCDETIDARRHRDRCDRSHPTPARTGGGRRPRRHRRRRA